ncbi:hypothetical protein FB45DRAFT_886067 [Roridomyces roridus]|uniref:Uncharacterized protein n=1 Tax=Roridomyces roridus TaxID=1738132 RepID=A0AAD7FYB5_9AGAR|nr:hypothetical protein FB45DRAFT_886067 [Roridomyces roridus]
MWFLSVCKTQTHFIQIRRILDISEHHDLLVTDHSRFWPTPLDSLTAMSYYNETAVQLAIDNQHFYNVNLGPFLTGIAAQIFMMGCLTIQMWKYFEFFWLTLKRHSQLLYNAFIVNYGQVIRWNRYGWTFIYEPAWTAVIAAMTQAFFLQRCWTVTKSIWLAVAGVVGILLSLGAGIATSAGLVSRPYYTETSQVFVQVNIWLIASAVTDVGISVILNPLTSLIATVDLILYITMSKENTVHLAVQMVVGKMYNHSVMVTLLARTGKPNPAGGVTVTRTQIRVTDHVDIIPMRSMGGEEEETDVDTSSSKMKIDRMV